EARIASTYSRTAASSPSAGTTWLTSPNSSARRAVIGRPVRSISKADFAGAGRPQGPIGRVQKKAVRTPGRAEGPPPGATARAHARHEAPARRCRQPLHAGDDRLRQTVQPEHDARAAREQLPVVLRGAAHHLAQVMARAEDRSPGRQYHGPHGGFGGDSGQ